MPARLRHCEWGAPPRFRASVARKPLSGSQGTGRCGRQRRSTSQETYPGPRHPPFRKRRSGAMARVVRLLVIPALVALALVAARASAQEPKKLDPVIVTGTKIETPAEQVGAT